jgi:hypothetical protein
MLLYEVCIIPRNAYHKENFYNTLQQLYNTSYIEVLRSHKEKTYASSSYILSASTSPTYNYDANKLHSTST